MQSRRDFIKRIMISIGGFAFAPNAFAKATVSKGPLEEAKATVYRSVYGTPVENIAKVIELLGGIEKIIGKDDVVVVKPNVQWWNQGVPNISALSALVELIFIRSGGFNGEVVIAENTHRGSSPWKHTGWQRGFDRNSDIEGIENYNDLSDYLKKKYKEKFSICHLIDADSGAKRVYSPNDGAGYVYCDGTGGVPLIEFNNGENGEDYRSVIMTYPIFKTDKGTVIDFKNGIWENGSYTNQPLKFINFAALNHHSAYCGATSAVKNYLGVSDLSGGADPHQGGKLTEKHYNFHSFTFDKWAVGPVPGMIGAEIGIFMETIRKADLNITTAEWVGLASRTEPPVARTRAVLASTDPVALDYHATKYLLYPNSKISVHNPDDEKSPVYQYLQKCAEQGGGIFKEKYVDIKSYDHRLKRMQRDDELVIKGDITWGTNLKMLMKYLVFRAGLV